MTEKGALRFYATRSVHTVSYVRNFGREEPETLRWIDAYVSKGSVLWDVGANIGLYSAYAGLSEGVRVFAFEPSALNFGLLAENLGINGLSNVFPMCVALSDETKIDQLHIRDLEVGHACNSIGNPETQFASFNPVFMQAVPCFRADDITRVLGVPVPANIKLDVDGAEPLILAGATGILKEVGSVLVEVQGRNEKNAEALIDAPLRQAGLVEDTGWRTEGSGRNRLYVRPSR